MILFDQKYKRANKVVITKHMSKLQLKLKSEK